MKTPRSHPPLNLLEKEAAAGPWAGDAAPAAQAPCVRRAPSAERRGRPRFSFSLLPLPGSARVRRAATQFSTPAPRNQKGPSRSRPGSAQERTQLPHSEIPFQGPQPAQGQKCAL